MGKTLLDIRVKYGTLSKSEKKIADFLLDGDGGEMPIYITDFARRCGTSEATVVRFAKRLGFEGFQQLKIAMAQQTENRPINADITFDDSAADVFAKICDDVYCSLEKTKKAKEIQAESGGEEEKPYPCRDFRHADSHRLARAGKRL